MLLLFGVIINLFSPVFPGRIAGNQLECTIEGADGRKAGSKCGIGHGISQL